jgi:DNA-binding helix-hairpin-helix protein with protein kinase domain
MLHRPMASTAPLFDAGGRRVALGREIAKGGEGAVFELPDRPEAVAKVYLKSPSSEQAEKLSAMAGMAQEAILKLAAWPIGTLHGPSGSLVGFTMPRIAGTRGAFELYSPKLRLQQFPRADWRFLVHAAGNAARAFRVLHEAGHVVGDVNERNLAIANDGTVRIFDCDSFQVTSGSRRWLCDVGVDTHQPPEMQRLSSYRGVVRTANHDLFGLAVLVFQCLCLARHPFSGIYVGAGEPPSIAEAIRDLRYVYGRNQARSRMMPPPLSLPIDAIGPTARDLFERAFSEQGMQANGRPTAAEWVEALDALGKALRPCAANPGHYYLPDRGACPWCDIEGRSGLTLFPVVLAENPQGSGIAAIWQQVLATRDPGPMPPFPVFQASSVPPSPAALALGRRARQKTVAAAAIGSTGLLALALFHVPTNLILAMALLATAAFVFSIPSRGPEADRIRDTRIASSERLDSIRKSWEAPSPGPSYAVIRQRLDTLKQSYDGLPTERLRKLEELRRGMQASQMTQHLNLFQIRDAKISGIGKARVATLQSWGIETAADLNQVRLLAVQGFGPATVAKAMAWRHGCERQFRFDPSLGVSAADTAAIEREVLLRRHQFEQEIASEAGKLMAAVKHAESKRRTLGGHLAELASTHRQAVADAAAARL